MSGKCPIVVRGSVGFCAMGVMLLAALFADGRPPDKTVKKTATGKNHAPPAALLASMARHLHSEAYRQFIKAPGFGSNREIALMVAKKRPWIMPKWTSEELAKMTAPAFWAGDLSLIHRLSVFQFAASNAPTGAKPAADGLPGKKTYQWDIKTLDLVGIAMHESPVVFISETVPQMKELKDKKTRPLDVFETEGVEELHNGKDLYIRSKDGTTRVLGPIRAGKACLKCHRDAKEGALLGAFSYTLRIGEYTLRGRRGQLDPYIRPGSQPLPKSN